MDEAHAHRQLPAVSVALQSSRNENLHQLPVVLPEPPVARPDNGPRRNIERCRNQRRKTFDQDAGNERDKDEIRVGVKGADSGVARSVVEPLGRLLDLLEEIAQNLRRALELLGLHFYARMDEAVQGRRRQIGDFLQYRIQEGIANGRMPNVVVGRRRVLETGLFVSRPVGGWNLRYRILRHDPPLSSSCPVGGFYRYVQMSSSASWAITRS